MSQIVFTTLDPTTKKLITTPLCGSERMYMKRFSDQTGDHMISLLPEGKLKSIVPSSEWIYGRLSDRISQEDMYYFRLWMRDSEAKFVIDGELYSTCDLLSNTAIAIGNDIIRMMVRIHNQCEIHLRVEGEDREWLAHIIQKGLWGKIIRNHPLYGDESGLGQWDLLRNFLVADDSQPVVMHYTVTDSFPYGVLTSPEKDFQPPISEEEIWNASLKVLREKEYPRLRPDGFSTTTFTHQKNLFWLMEVMNGL